MKHSLLFILIFSQFILAQYTQLDTGVISGEVLSANTGSAIEYASVSLISKKSNEAEMGQLTDIDGNFIFQNIAIGYYFLEIRFMGFESWISKEIYISKENNRQYIGRIELKQKLLKIESVDIKEKKETYEFEVDKIVYNPENDIIGSSGSAEDVLINAPMVTIDQDGEVQLRGKSNVNILIDGRKNRIDLSNISGSQIEKVEVITSPSAKYDPEGMAGIINIILKKGSNDGFTGSIETNGGHNQYHSIDGIHGLNVFGNYKKGSLNIFSSIGLNHKQINRSGYRNTITTYIDTIPRLLMGHRIYGPDIVDTLFYDYENKIKRSNINFRFGFDYFLNHDLVLTSEFKFSNYTKLDSAIQNFKIPAYNPQISIEEAGMDNSNFDLEYLIMLEQEFKVPDQELKFYFSEGKRENHQFSSLISSDNDQTEFIDIDNRIEIDFSYKTPFLSNQKIEFGYDSRIINNKNIMSFDIETIMGDNFYIDTIASNFFQLNRNVHSFFIEYDNQITEKLSFKPSVRYEYVDKEIIFSTSFDTTLVDQSWDAYSNVLDNIIRDASRNSPYVQNEGAFYPNLSIQYKFSKNQSLTFGLGKRVDRAGGGNDGSWQIMPFPKNIYNDRFTFIGNPYLKPEYSTQYEINYSRPIPMGYANFNIFYNEITNLIEWYNDDSYQWFDILTFKNVDHASTSGVGFFATMMGQTFGGSYTKTDQRDDNNPDDYELNENSESINIFSKIKLPEQYIKFFDFEFDLYWMKLKLPNGSMFGDKGTAWANLGISKTMLNNRLTLSFTIANLFNSGDFQMTRTKPVPSYFYNTGTADGEIQDSYFSYEQAIEFSDIYSLRNSRTFNLTLKYQLGKNIEENKKGFMDRKSLREDDGMMERTY